MLLCVARQEETTLPVFEADNERIVVFGGWRNFFWRNLWPEEGNAKAIPIERLALPFVFHRNAKACGQLLELCLCGCCGFAAQK